VSSVPPCGAARERPPEDPESRPWIRPGTHGPFQRRKLWLAHDLATEECREERCQIVSCRNDADVAGDGKWSSFWSAEPRAASPIRGDVRRPIARASQLKWLQDAISDKAIEPPAGCLLDDRAEHRVVEVRVRL